MMHDANHRQESEVRIAYKQGWELRADYYDRLLRNMMDLIEVVLSIMKVDGLSEPSQSLKKALLEIEDAWAVVSLEKSSGWSAGEEIERKNRGELKVLRNDRQV